MARRVAILAEVVDCSALETALVVRSADEQSTSMSHANSSSTIAVSRPVGG